MITVVVLGGYGNFGSKIVEQLSKESDLHIVVAGRNLSAAQAYARSFSSKTVTAAVVDLDSAHFSDQLQAIAPAIVIHTCGPFQAQDYHVAEVCIDLKIHYIDLADGRAFVNHFATLDDRAKAAGVLAISGTSTVPGLSSAVMDALLPQFQQVLTLDYGISPGNRARRGQATIAAILSYTGKKLTRLEKGRWCSVYGWQDVHAHDFPAPIGKRWLANCDIPDLDLFVERYPTLQSIRFYAGLELTLLHFAMWAMSWCARLKIIKNWKAYAKPITRMSQWFEAWGSDAGGMYLRLSGLSLDGQPKTVVWTLVAEDAHGPYIPTVAAVILAKKIARGQLRLTGAMTSMGLFTLEEFVEAVSGWNIYFRVTERAEVGL